MPPPGFPYPNQPGQANLPPQPQYGYPAPYQPRAAKTEMSLVDLFSVILFRSNAPYKFRTSTILSDVGHKLGTITLILTLVSLLFSIYVIVDLSNYVPNSATLFMIFLAILIVLFGVLVSFAIYWALVVLDYLTTIKNQREAKP
jgi:hypothetical protein